MKLPPGCGLARNRGQRYLGRTRGWSAAAYDVILGGERLGVVWKGFEKGGWWVFTPTKDAREQRDLRNTRDPTLAGLKLLLGLQR